MGNKLVCCRWRWIESPEFTNRPDNNICKYGNAIDNYTNGYMNQNCSADNGYVSTKYQIKLNVNSENQLINCANENVSNGIPCGNGKPMNPYQQHSNNNSNCYPMTNIICPAPFYPNKNQICYQQNNTRFYHQMNNNNNGMEGSYRDSWMVKSTDQLQHISEREPEDVEHDPSINAKHPTLFLKRSKEDIENNLQRRRIEKEKLVQRGLSRWSSCSTILLDDTTISQPNPALSLKALALAIHLHVRSDENSNDQRYRCSRDDSVYAIFDERRHPVVRAGSHGDSMRCPSHREIYRFLRGIFNMAQLTPECAIVTLVYLERLLSSAEIEILPWSWRRQVLASVLLASKVWDDQAVWNADYCQILKDLCVEDVNELERNFLELIQFNINVPSSVYAHYYFDLLQLGRNNGLYNQPSTRHTLLWDRAIRLEAVNCPAGPIDDYSTRWWIKPRPLSRFLSWESINATPSVRRVILS